MRKSGFRLSLTDVFVIPIAAPLCVYFWNGEMEVGRLFAIVLGHFFLFCNVFRLRPKFELIWAAIFMINFTAQLMLQTFSWPRLILIQIPFTIATIALEMFSKRYHGVFARRVNAKYVDAWERGEI